jgi:hypothetical protein
MLLSFANVQYFQYSRIACNDGALCLADAGSESAINGLHKGWSHHRNAILQLATLSFHKAA